MQDTTQTGTKVQDSSRVPGVRATLPGARPWQLLRLAVTRFLLTFVRVLLRLRYEPWSAEKDRIQEKCMQTKESQRAPPFQPEQLAYGSQCQIGAQ